MKTALFQSCGHCRVFQICWHIECSTFTASSFRIWNSSTGILSPPLALFPRLIYQYAMERYLIFHLQLRMRLWRRQWHPTPVLLHGKSHGWRRLVGCSPWGHDESDTTERLHFHFFTFLHWRRKWQPTPVFLPGESQGRGSLVGCHLRGCTELDTTEVT